jgi:hypothetical protein
MREYKRNSMISYLKTVVIELTLTLLYNPNQIMGKMWFAVGESLIVMFFMAALFEVYWKEK